MTISRCTTNSAENNGQKESQPDFNSQGEFRRHLVTLARLAKTKAPTLERDSVRRTTFVDRNSPFLIKQSIDGVTMNCSAWKPDVFQPSAINIAFTRASGNPSVYNLHGMFQSAQRAAEALAALYEEKRALMLALANIFLLFNEMMGL